MVIDKNVAYLGSTYPHHIKPDIKEIVEMGCTSINITVSEKDWLYYRRARKHIIDVAKENGLKVYLNLHGYGIFASSIPCGYLIEHPESQQILNSGKQVLTHCCPNHEGFREWFKGTLKEMIDEFKPYGVFWDEPQFKPNDNFPEEWSCRCENCKEKYRSIYHEEMPDVLTDRVMEFRQDSLLDVLKDYLKFAKTCGIQENVLCLMVWDRNPKADSFKLGWYGVMDWDPFIQIEDLDVFSTDPYWIHWNNYELFTANTRIAVERAHHFGKKCQIWTQAVWIPEGKEKEVKRTILESAEMGADMLAVWSYRAEPGSNALYLGGDFDKVWQMVKEGYAEV